MVHLRVLKVIIYILLSGVFFFMFISAKVVFDYLTPEKIVSFVTPEAIGLEYEEVYFETSDGLKLHGWYVPRQAGGIVSQDQDSANKAIILLHGWPVDKGDVLMRTAFFAKHYNLFYFDFRALGKSEGKYSTIGAREIIDLASAAEHLGSRGINELGVWGFSMGGAVALMGSPEILEVKAVVSEASYARLDLMAREVFRMPNIVKSPAIFTTRILAKIVTGVDIKEVAPAEKARELNVPVLIIHSRSDEIVPFSHAVMIQNALSRNPNAEFWFENGLIHGEATLGYENRILTFFKENLK